MRTFLKLGKVCLATLVIVVVSSLAFGTLVRIQEVVSPVLSKAQATHVALNYLADNNVLRNPSTANASFYQGGWYVMLIMDPAKRDVILVEINPITGKAKFVPLR